MKTRGHDRLPTFGVGADRSKGEWQTIFRQLGVFVGGWTLEAAEALRHVHGRQCWWNHLEARWSCTTVR